MASTNRSRRGHLSAKVPNVKLRPVPSVSASTNGKSKATTEDEDEAEEEQQPIGMRGRSGLRNIVKGRERSLSTENLMDKEIRRSMYAKDVGGMEDEDNNFQDYPSSLKPFQNLIVCFTGISSEEKPALSNLLKNLGVLKIESNFTIAVNVLVSNGFGSPKYLCALENRIPIVTTDWIKKTHSKWIEGGHVDVEKSLSDYRLLAFKGLKIAISGIEPVERRLQMQQLISEHGGVYSKNLDHRCTHLVVASPQSTTTTNNNANANNNNNANNDNNNNDTTTNYSAKVRWALESHKKLLKPGQHPPEYAKEYIHTVWEGWFWDCVGFGGRWVEGRWDLRGTKRPERVESMIEKERAAIEAKQKAEDALAAQSLIDSVVQHDNDAAQQVAGGDAMDIDYPLAIPEILEPAQIRKRPREEGSSSTITGAGGSKARGVSGAAGGVKGLVDDLLVSVHRDRNVGSAMDVDLPETKPQLVDTPDTDLADQSTSRKRPRLALVGSQEKDRDSQPDISTTKSSPRRVSAKSKSKAGLSSMLHASREQAFTKEEQVDEKPITETSKPLIPVSTATISSPQEGKGENGLPLKYNSELFKGLSFGHTVMEKGKTLETALQLCGGRVVSREEVEKGEAVDYMVVRLSAADMAGIPDDSKAQVVTECWVERCLAANRVVSPDENIVCRPLTISTPVRGIEHIKIHVSGLSAAQTSYAKRLIKALGCTVSVVFSKLKTTHLVLDSPQTVNATKFEKAKQWNMPTVTLEWLYAIATSGNLEPIEPYVVEALPAAVEGANQPSGSNPSKRLISSVATANLSMMNESPNLFAFADSSGVGAMGRDGSQSISARSRLGSQPKQKLGLTPTELNPLESSAGAHHPFSPARKTTDRLVNGTTSSELVHDQSLAGPSKGALPTTSNPFRVVKDEARKRNESSSTSTILPADLFDRLEKADAGAEERKQRGVRRPRLNAVRKNSGATTRSIMSSSTTSAKQPDEDDDREMSVGMEGVEYNGQLEDQGDQSIRVRYSDPAADKEKKKLLDALTKPEGSSGRRR